GGRRASANKPSRQRFRGERSCPPSPVRVRISAKSSLDIWSWTIMSAIAQLRGVLRRRAPGVRRVWRFLTGEPSLRRTLEERYARLCVEDSDIREHLPTLRQLASECDVVVEFGAWFCKATTALALGARRKFITC